MKEAINTSNGWELEYVLRIHKRSSFRVYLTADARQSELAPLRPRDGNAAGGVDYGGPRAVSSEITMDYVHTAESVLEYLGPQFTGKMQKGSLRVGLDASMCIRRVSSQSIILKVDLHGDKLIGYVS